MFGERILNINEETLIQLGKKTDLAIITAAVLIVLFVGYITIKEIVRKQRSKNASEF